MNIFELTDRPKKSLLYKGHDLKSDKRLGAFIKTDEQDIKDCQFLIIGCPQDEGVKRNNGRIGTRNAPDKIREWLYKLNLSSSIENKGIFDLGNLKIGETLEETHENLYVVVKSVLEMNKNLIILGGGNDISYPDCKALSDVSSSVDNLLVINIDKHFDIRDMTPMNSGTPYRFLLNEKKINPKNFVEFGYVPYFNSEVYIQYLLGLEAQIYSLDEIRKDNIVSLFGNILKNKQIKDIFWGFDIDSISSKDAPGVSSSYPVGFSTKEIIKIAELAGKDNRTKIVEFTEMNPEFDIDNRTAKLTAILIYTYISESSQKN